MPSCDRQTTITTLSYQIDDNSLVETLLMNVTLEEAIEIFARASRTRFGANAVLKTQERIDQLDHLGDAEGVRVWEHVRLLIQEMQSKTESAQDAL